MDSCSLFNSLAAGKFEWHFRYLIFQIISVIDGWRISCELALRWMSLDSTDDKSTLVQVMSWCCQATSHYMSQCWPRSLSPYDVTRPQWVKLVVQLFPPWINVHVYTLSISVSFTIHLAFEIVMMISKVKHAICQNEQLSSGGCLNIKMSSYQYQDSHYKDNMVSWPSYLYNWNSHTWKDCLDIERGPRLSWKLSSVCS